MRPRRQKRPANTAVRVWEVVVARRQKDNHLCATDRQHEMVPQLLTRITLNHKASFHNSNLPWEEVAQAEIYRHLTNQEC